MNQGTGQTERYLTALNTEYFSIDERNLNDFVDFASKFSEFINFYNTENNLDGNWSTFFNNDITFLLIKISSIKIESIENEFDKISINEPQNLKLKIDFIYRIFDLIETWKNKLEEEEEFFLEIKKLINHIFNKIAFKLIEFEKAAKEDELITDTGKIYNFSFSSDWKVNIQMEDSFSFESFANEEKSSEANYFLGNHLIAVLNTLQLIIDSAKIYSEKRLTEYSENKPYITLFLAFIDIYDEARNEINKFSHRHLDYHFYDILKFQKNSENPDSVFLNFVLQNGIENTILKKGTLLSAGADSQGNEINYAVNDDLIITKAQIADIKAIVNHEHANIFKNNSKREVIFLNKELNKNITIEEPVDKGYFIGFAIASSFLKLEEGQRVIKFTFEFQRFSFEKFKSNVQENVLSNVNIDVYTFDEFTGNMFHFSYGNIENETQQWFNVPLNNISSQFQKSEEGNILHRLVIEVNVEDVFPPISTCISDEFPEATNRNLPVVKFFLNSEKIGFYNYIKELIIDKIAIGIEVMGVKKLKLQNDYGVIDTESPFEPFGPVPTIGSTFYIGHQSIFSQQLDEIHINFEWNDVPLLDYGFPEYYEGYSYIDSNDVFKAKLSVLHNKKWLPAENKQIVNLFEDIDMQGEPEIPVNNFRLINDIDIDKINSQYKGKPPVFNNDYSYSSSTRNGYIKLEFCYPPNGFGHKEYPDIIKKSMAGSIKKKVVPETPNEPWTPTLKSVSVDYASSIVIDFDNQEPKNRAFFYEIHPFGISVVSETVGKQINIMPFYNKGSEIYLAIENMTELQTLSVFFYISEFASDYINEKNVLKWNFLLNNEWIELKDENIISDTTNELLNSGIIVFDFSSFKNKEVPVSGLLNNSICPSGFLWLKCQSIYDEKFINNIISIKCQAITATYQKNTENSEHLSKPLQPFTIQSFVEEHPNIAEIHQETKSFDGKSQETDEQFYVKVSERLRHKNRAVTKWDYEHIILQNFSEINRVFCLNNKNQNIEFEPGCITIIVLPDVTNTISEVVFEPKFTISKLNKIHELVKNKTSPFVKLNICNPVYEKVQVKFEVKFYSGLNEKYYLQKTNEDIKRYLNPWLFDENVNISFSNEIYGSHILYYLETRDYIDYISNFAVYHIDEENIVNLDNAFENDVVLKPRTEVSVFISADNHIISIIGEKNESETIESMVLEADFILKKDFRQIIVEKGLSKEQVEINFTVDTSSVNIDELENISINIDNFEIN